MGARELTTGSPGSDDGEVADGPSAAAAAKKRKRQQALAAAAANGHVSRVSRRKAGAPAGAGGRGGKRSSNGALAVEESRVAEELSEDGVGRDERAGARVLDEPPGVEERSEDGAALGEPAGPPVVDESSPDGAAPGGPGGARFLDDPRPAIVDAPAVDEAGDAEPATEAGRRARQRTARDGARTEPGSRTRRRRPRRRTAGDASTEPAPPRRRARRRRASAGEPRGRAARRAEAARHATPAARRAQLVATAAEIAAAADAAPEPTAEPRRGAKVVRRVVAVSAILLVPASVYALVATSRPSATLSHADAAYLSSQLVAADQAVRTQLARLRPLRSYAALARTRDAALTARSLALEVDSHSGVYADALQRALTLEAAWLDAVGSVLANPRSALRAELVPRDAALRAAIDDLPVAPGRRRGGAVHLVRYAEARIAARSAGRGS